MSQHFLLSPAAKTLTLAHVMRMSNEEAETMFARIRWHETDGGSGLPALRRSSGLQRPPPQWPATLALQGVQQGVHHDQRHAVRVA